MVTTLSSFNYEFCVIIENAAREKNQIQISLVFTM